MRTLPVHHVRRPRLISACEGHQVVVVEAAGGYGKSVLAAELVDSWGVVGIDVVLRGGAVPASAVVSRLRAAIAAAGFTGAADNRGASRDDPIGAIDRCVQALEAESCAFIIDDAHHADRDAGVLIDRIASQLTDDQRLVVLARRLPEGSERLRRADALQLTASDLALSCDEVLHLLRGGFGLDVDEGAARAVDSATGGWTAAAVLAAARAARTGESVVAVAARSASDARHHSVAAILEDPVAAMGTRGRRSLAQLARLPVLTVVVVDDALGSGFFDRALAAGVPLAHMGDGVWELAGPVRDHLASLDGPDAPSLHRAARRYVEMGLVSEAVELLLANGDDLAAASLLCDSNLAVSDTMDVHDYRAAVARLSDAAIDAHPMVLVVLAQCLDAEAKPDERAATLDRIERLFHRLDDPALARAHEAERAIDELRDGRVDAAEIRARAILEATPRREARTRARLLSCVGRCLCRHVDVEGRRDVAALRDADARLEEAELLYASVGMRVASAGMTPYRAMGVEFARGNARRALQRLDEAIASIADRPWHWAHLHTLRAEVALELGRHDEAWRSVDEVLRVAAHLGDDQLCALAHWRAMSASSHAGDAVATLSHLREVEAHRGDWWDAAGPAFCASATDDLARIGEKDLAAAHLAMARARPGGADAAIAMADASFLARHGDPIAADAALAAAPRAGIDPRELWRVELLRAYAAYRRGDGSAGPLAAGAFEQASRLRLDHLPLTKERVITHALLALAVETGQPAASALSVAVLPVTIAVLGRFELTRGGRRVPLTASLGTQLLKLVAVNGGTVAAAQAIELLWPDAAPEAGRNRLRTVLNRLRAEAGDVVVREGDVLALHDEVTVDLTQFVAEARRAKAAGRTEPAVARSLARVALSRYRGDVLPDDRYDDWAQAARDDARRLVLDLLELCSEIATERGDLDETRWAVERAIELAPDDDRWSAVAAETLVKLGRRGAALSVLRRARGELERQGIALPERLVALEASIRDLASSPPSAGSALERA